MTTLSENEKKIILESIREIPDFPKKGIVFKDITTLISNPHALNTLMTHLEERYKTMDIDYVAGIDARGFIFGSILADRLGVGFVTIRKKGKLPYTTVSEKYSLEYGYDEVEIHIDAFGNNIIDNKPNVLLMDDLIATGGTAAAAVNLINKVGGVCIEACFVLGIPTLQGDKKLNTNVYSVIKTD